jgi:hypothetical protein
MRELGRWLLAGIPALIIAGSSAAQTPREPVDLELVIAADISQSLDLDEHHLQRQGYVEAFRNAGVIAAMTSGPRKRVAVTYMEFAGVMPPIQSMPWTIIDGEAAARAFADRLAAQPIYGEQQTSISGALYEAARLIDSNDIVSERKVINVSGDGANGTGAPIETARDDLVKRGFVINGLPILLNKPKQYYDIDQVDRYYERCVIGGAGAFVAPLSRLDQVASALRRTFLPASTAPGTQSSPQAAASPVDCLAGEKAQQAARTTRN